MSGSYVPAKSVKRQRGDEKSDDDDNNPDDDDSVQLDSSSSRSRAEIVIDSDDDSDTFVFESPNQVRAQPRSTTMLARGVAGPMPAYLANLIDTRTFNGSNPVKWFSMATIQRKALKLRQACRVVDQYTNKDGQLTHLTRLCGCMTPDGWSAKKRPEVKLTEPFVITAAQRQLISNHWGQGANTFSRVSIRLNETKKGGGHSILMKKAVRAHSIMYADKIQNVWDTNQLFNGKMTQWEVSHLCNNGHEGCINPVHLHLEPKTINLERRWCWMAIKCAVNGCTGYIIGNPCQGHGLDPNGLAWPKCVKASAHTPCAHYSAHAVVAAQPP